MTNLKKYGEISQLELHAADESLGKLHEVYFDCDNWLIRYMSVGEGTLAPHKVHLIPALALDGIHKQDNALYVELTRDEVLGSPALDARLDVSRSVERDIYDYYGWPVYWEHEHGMQVNSAHSQYPYVPPGAYHQGQALVEDHILCTMSELDGYRLRADGSTVGQVCDAIIDTRRWCIAYLEFETQQAEANNGILEPRDVQYVDWTDKQIVANLGSG